MDSIDDDTHFNRIPWSTTYTNANDDVINNDGRSRPRGRRSDVSSDSGTGSSFSTAWTSSERCNSCPRRFSFRQPLVRYQNDFGNRNFADSDFPPISVVSDLRDLGGYRRRNDLVERFQFESSPRPKVRKERGEEGGGRREEGGGRREERRRRLKARHCKQ
jgi:hypothetical protein